LSDARRWLRVAPLALGLVGLPAAAQDAANPGKAPYDRWCAGCHGVDGAGQGDAAAYMLPRPRDFTKALYQIRTTGTGQLPTDADILHVIDEGMPGTAMPGWRGQLSNQEREALVDYLKTFSAFFEAGAPEPLEFSSPPGTSDEGLEEGRRLYQEMECWKCHGQTGRGDGASAPEQEDDGGHPIRPADLTQPWLYNGGGTVEDIYRRLRTGLDGTPMPSYGDLIAAEVITDEQLWRIAQYVRSLGPERDPEVREVVRAARVEALPATLSDTAWDEVERFWIPLAGQIIIRPRWFAPAVTGVWVQALHDGSDLALRLAWSDRSRSPDPVWSIWRDAVAAGMEPKEGDSPAAEAVADTAAAAASALPDAIAVQFPQTLPTGMDRPYFLMGDARNPVNLWRWQSEPETFVEQVARGFGRTEALDGNRLTGEAAFVDGEWQVVFRRALRTSQDTTVADPDRIEFPLRTAVPMAVFAWDGDNTETGTRGAISTWYYVYLDEPTSGGVYATPVLAFMLTAGLGLFVVRRAQQRERAAGNTE
jgi:cytochrome c oxidase cbb3-type subunit 2